MNRKKLLAGLLILAPGTAFAHTIRPDSIALNEAVVTGTCNRTDIRYLPQTITVVGRQELTVKERTNILPTLMEQVPGMMVTGRGLMGYGVSGGGSGGMMLRGISSGSGQLMVLIDGHPQYNGIYGHSIADSYRTMMAERVEVLRGPASMLYGSNAMGGVVNIVTKQADDNASTAHLNLGAGSYGTFQSEADYGVKIGKLSLNASGVYNRSDNHRRNMGFEEYGGFIKLQYDLSTHWQTYADVDLTHFNASYPGTLTTPMLEADQWITRGAVAVGIENHYGRTNGRLSLYDNFGRHKINDGYNAFSGSPQSRLFRSKDALTGVSWYQSLGLSEGSRLTIGTDYQNIYGHAYYTDKETGEVLETPNKQSGKKRNHEMAGYVDLRQDITQWMTAEAGVRYDHHTEVGGEWIPQFGMVFRPLSEGTIKLSASKGFRNPTMREMYLYPPSNTDLKPERMWSYEVAWKHSLTDYHLQYGINMFLIRADNIIQTVNRQNINTGKLNNKGIEADIHYCINSHWALNTNHAWLDMRHPVVSAPKYKGYLGVSMNYGRWSGNVGLMQVCGLYTAIGEKASTEDFTLLDAILSYAICSPVRIWVKGDNLLAQKYEYIAGMPMPKATFMAGVNINL